ncbi:MAG: electron transfer flavoprotein subunit alpha/FixB family protein [Desulfobacterales bacterium]
MANVLIISEHHKGKLKKSTLNSITFGRKAAEKVGGKLYLLVIGYCVKDIADQLTVFGADKIYLVDDCALSHYTAQSWAGITAEAAQISGSQIIGICAGTTGKDFMPRVAAKLNAGMSSAVIDFDGTFFTREMWAGHAVAEIEIKTDIKCVTIQHTAFDPAHPVGRQTPVERISVPVPESDIFFVEMQETVNDRPDLIEANIVIAGGRGMKSRENFKLLEDLADIFGAAVGATRSAVDAGWAPNDLQIGQTGKIVAPDLYFAVGLSGAAQHTAGMKNSKIIVAINKDEDAPIFRVADYGLVGDLFYVVPVLTKAIKNDSAV